jgi:putative SOS response-associated peptidase YedK
MSLRRPRDGTRELTLARWGLVPFWMKALPKVPHINARMETVSKLPYFGRHLPGGVA